MAKPKAMVSSRLAKLPKWKAWCSCELERATLAPNPGDQDDRESAEEVAAHRDEHVGMTG